MIEPTMFFGIGFMIASLLALMIVPLVHGRAVRLTMRRLEATTPMAMAEIQADKDQLRAEFAMATRRLEMTVDQLKASTTGQLADIGRKNDALNKLRAELGDKTAVILGLEAREKALSDQLQAVQSELAAKSGSLQDARRSLEERHAELARVNAALAEQTMLSDSQRVELVAMRTQLDALRDRAGEFERQARDVDDRVGHVRTEGESASAQLAQERGRANALAARVTQLEQQLASQRQESDAVFARAQDSDRRLSDRGRMLAERDQEREQLQAGLQAARTAEAALRAEVAELQQRYGSASENFQSQTSRVHQQLENALAERDQLQQQVSSLKREADTSWAAERVENALLRERINDVAAEIARLTIALEGPESPVEAMITRAQHAGQNGAASGNGDAAHAPDPGGKLIERIRALQSKASQLPQPT
jgi:chromosome segregation ATPase